MYARFVASPPTHRALALPGPGARVVVVADTHSRPHPATHDLIRAEAPAAILHAGDVGDAQVLDELAALAPLIAVRGNIDAAGLAPDHTLITITRPGGQTLRVLLTHIAVRGPRLQADAARLARSEDAAVVVCGHSHVPLVARDQGVVVFNPGSVGPRRFGLPITLGVMDFGAAGLSLRHMDCETGARWLPPAY